MAAAQLALAWRVHTTARCCGTRFPVMHAIRAPCSDRFPGPFCETFSWQPGSRRHEESIRSPGQFEDELPSHYTFGDVLALSLSFVIGADVMLDSVRGQLDAVALVQFVN
jgi:hypothetical protein